MKKTWIIVITILIVGILMFSIAACTSVETESKPNTSMFIQVERTYEWRVVYHRDTKVMYAVSDSDCNHGTFTLLVDADGTPMLWEDTE